VEYINALFRLESRRIRVSVVAVVPRDVDWPLVAAIAAAVISLALFFVLGYVF
jgi:hypothetical protein